MVDDAGPSGDQRTGFVDYFASRPVFVWLGLVGALASIVALPLAVYLYEQSIRSRELVYSVNPVRTVVVQAGEMSRLHVLFSDETQSDFCKSGSELSVKNVTAAQIAIWNEGKESIRPGNLLEPIVIHTTPPVPILEATIRKQSRDVIHLLLDQSRSREGILGVSWNIVEQDDGGVIQLVIAGNEGTLITVSGVVEGQREIHRYQYSGKIKSPTEQLGLFQRHRTLRFSLAFALTIGWVVGTLWLGITVWKARYRPFPATLFGVSELLALAFQYGVLMYTLFSGQVPSPPFGF
ncbi:MAG: hypothetical protein ABSD20_09925 [Terriglobales bacterium]